MWRRARSAAGDSLERNLEVFARVGHRLADRPSPYEARLESDGGLPLRLQMRQQGRIFGGSYALEVATAQPLLPETSGLVGRARGAVRLKRVTFRARRGDEAGQTLARRLNADEAVQETLKDVHFERVRVDPDGRATIRHMGGSVVWVLFPPIVRPVPLVDEQARATVAALEAFAAAAAR